MTYPKFILDSGGKIWFNTPRTVTFPPNVVYFHEFPLTYMQYIDVYPYGF